MMEENGIVHPQVFFSDRDEVLLNSLELVFPNCPSLLCLWHIVKVVETHARQHRFPRVLNTEKSTDRTPKWKDSEQHREFCDAFLDLVRARTEPEYKDRRAYLHRLSHEEPTYIDTVWLDIWKRRIVRCWTNDVVHFGLQATSRGYHASLKKWLGSSRSDILTMLNLMRHWWNQSIHQHKAIISDSQIKMQNRLRRKLFAGVVRKIHVHALKCCLSQLQTISRCLCSGVYSKTTGLPCFHKLLEIEEANGTLTPQDFHAHWWITYQDATRAPAPIILEPETIASRRQERRRSKKARKQRAGVNGTRRDPNRFELSQTTNVVLPTMAAALQTASTPKHRLPQMRFNAIN